MLRLARRSSILLLLGVVCALGVHAYMLADVGVGTPAPMASEAIAAAVGHERATATASAASESHEASHAMTATWLAILGAGFVFVAIRRYRQVVLFHLVGQHHGYGAVPRRRRWDLGAPARARPSPVERGNLLLI